MAENDFTVGPEDATRLKQTIDAALVELQEIEDRQEALKDLVKTVAGELSIKPAELMQSIKTIHKNSLDDLHAKTDMIDNIVNVYKKSHNKV
jgi:division protein CdvB (Snf7/Vps24/ESCRT-III family)